MALFNEEKVKTKNTQLICAHDHIHAERPGDTREGSPLPGF